MLVLDPKFEILNKVKKVTEKKDPFFRSADPQIRDPKISDPRLLNVRSRIIDLPEHRRTDNVSNIIIRNTRLFVYLSDIVIVEAPSRAIKARFTSYD
tara:strand:+ start:342 stop:632 length:291 start_codon:yes stop_codon:yes gene_type:complete